MKSLLKLIVINVAIGIFMFVCYFAEYSIINIIYRYASNLLNIEYSRTISIILFIVFMRVVEIYDKN